MLTTATPDDFFETGQSSVRARPTLFLGPIRPRTEPETGRDSKALVI
jgi:hypothetical protein